METWQEAVLLWLALSVGATVYVWRASRNHQEETTFGGYVCTFCLWWVAFLFFGWLTLFPQWGILPTTKRVKGIK